MPRPAPNLADQEPSVSAELPEEGDFDFEDIRIRKPPPAWTTTAIVSCVVAWGALAVHNLIVLPKLDGVPPVSFDRITTARKGVPRYVIIASSSASSLKSREYRKPPWLVGRTLALTVGC